MGQQHGGVEVGGISRAKKKKTGREAMPSHGGLCRETFVFLFFALSVFFSFFTRWGDSGDVPLWEVWDGFCGEKKKKVPKGEPHLPVVQ